MSAMNCKIPVSILKSPPFNLPWGYSVYAKLIATNAKGSSSFSNVGNGAKIVAIPDIPTNLTEYTTQRTSTTLGITWTPGLPNGTPIINFIISYAINSGSYSVLATSSLNYFVAFSLNPGTYYSFKV